MYNAGHITNNEEGIKFFEKYDVEYKQMKQSGELRGKMTTSNKAYEFWKNAEDVLKGCGAGMLIDHIDVWEDKDGQPIVTLSPYHGMVTEGLKDRMRNHGFVIEYANCTPYMGADMIVVRAA